MDATRWERWDAASGFLAFATGAAGGALERGWPSANDPTAVAAFIAEHRGAILGQSMLFVLSSVIMIWFFGCVRARLARAEGEAGSGTRWFPAPPCSPPRCGRWARRSGS